MLIRLANLTDIAGIMQVISVVVPVMQVAGNFQWDNTYPNPGVFENDIALNQLWVAVIDDEIAGVTAITTDQSPEYADIGWDINETAIVTHRLAVHPKYGGRGVGAALLLQAEHEAVKRGITVLRIDTNTKNQATQALFSKIGYVYTGEIGLEFRPGLRFYCYEKRLNMP